MYDTNNADMLLKQKCESVTFKVIFILCVAILAIFSSIPASDEATTTPNFSQQNAIAEMEVQSKVVGFIKHEGAIRFTAIERAPDWTKKN